MFRRGRHGDQLPQLRRAVAARDALRQHIRLPVRARRRRPRSHVPRTVPHLVRVGAGRFIIRTARVVCAAGSMKRFGVRPSVCRATLAHDSKPVAAGLLLWARLAENIDQLMQQRRANAGSATLSAYAGSETQTSCFRRFIYTYSATVHRVKFCVYLRHILHVLNVLLR